MSWLSRILGASDVHSARAEADDHRADAAEALDRAQSNTDVQRDAAVDDAGWAATQARWAADDARSAADDASLEAALNPGATIEDQLAVGDLELAALDAELAADEAQWDAWEAEDLGSDI
jgi:hypothetical protein